MYTLKDHRHSSSDILHRAARDGKRTWKGALGLRPCWIVVWVTDISRVHLVLGWCFLGRRIEGGKIVLSLPRRGGSRLSKCAFFVVEAESRWVTIAPPSARSAAPADNGARTLVILSIHWGRAQWW